MSRNTVLVIGMGVSGMATLRLVDALGARGLATDDGAVPTRLPGAAEYLTVAEASGVLGEVSCVVASPGVPASHTLLAAARERAVAVKSELAFAAEFVDAPIIAVTGTNGKSTVTTLVGRMLEREAYRLFVGGNLGNPLSNAAAPLGQHYDYCVVEVSSFQLEWPGGLRPRIAAVLNVSPDHLDRHGDVETYIATKMRVFACMNADDRAVLGRGQAWWPPRVTALAPALSSFGTVEPCAGECGTVAHMSERRVVAWGSGSDAGVVWEVALRDTWPHARHDFDNVAAAAEIARLAGAGPRAIQRALAGFEGLDHRLRCVGAHAGVTFWNDSKATNVGATLASLEAFDEPVILLAGGTAKGADFAPLAELADGVRSVVVYGEAADSIAAALEGRTVLMRAAGLDQAFTLACQRARRGDVVLLAPACASFDEFASYSERGRRFNELVAGLAHGG